MNSPTHTIDPDGEVIIILLNANSPFAQLDEDAITSLESNISLPLCDNAQSPPEMIEVSIFPVDESKLTVKQRKAMKKKKKNRKLDPILANFESTSPNEERPIEDALTQAPMAEEYPAEGYPTEDAAPAEAPAAEEPVAGECLAEEATPGEVAPEEAAPEETFAGVPVQSCFRIQVSAKHLMFASPVFKRILTGDRKESITYFQKGSVEITAETWDIEALMIVLQAIHGQYYLIPETLTLEMLAKVAVIADYYECQNALYLLTDMWVKKIEGEIPFPTTVSRDLILWLWIAWFFQLPYQFKLSTSIAMAQSDGVIDTLGLPIPDNVIGLMKECRDKAINDMILLLYETREAFLHCTRGCSFECRSIMYGALTMQMQSSNLLLPKPETPFSTLNYNCLVQKVMAFESPRWYHSCHTYSSHECSDSSFASVFAQLKNSLEGLELNRSTSL